MADKQDQPLPAVEAEPNKALNALDKVTELPLVVPRNRFNYDDAPKYLSEIGAGDGAHKDDTKIAADQPIALKRGANRIGGCRVKRPANGLGNFSFPRPQGEFPKVGPSASRSTHPVWRDSSFPPNAISLDNTEMKASPLNILDSIAESSDSEMDLLQDVSSSIGPNFVIPFQEPISLLPSNDHCHHLAGLPAPKAVIPRTIGNQQLSALALRRNVGTLNPLDLSSISNHNAHLRNNTDNNPAPAPSQSSPVMTPSTSAPPPKRPRFNSSPNGSKEEGM